MKSRVLVLGAGHFVGSRVEAALAAGDWAEPVPFRGSIRTLSKDHFDGIHAVFNGTLGSPDDIVAAARLLAGGLPHSAAVRVVHLSSMTVYGSISGRVTEDTDTRADLGAYGAAQIDAEASVRRLPNSVILRPGCEYGPGCPQWSDRIGRLLASHRLGDLGVHGDGVCNLVFVNDLVAAIVASLRVPDIEGRSYNLAMPAPPTWNDYLSQFARALGAVPVSRVTGRRLRIESRLLAPPLKILEMLERRLTGRTRIVPPAVTPSLLGLCRQDLTLVSERAECELAIAWTPLTDGLRAAASAFREAYSTGSISIRRNSIG